MTLNLDPYYQINPGKIWIKIITESVSSNAPSTAYTPNTAIIQRVKRKLLFLKLVVSDFNEEEN